MKYKIRVEYEVTPIRHLVVQCPYCENWFDAHDILDTGDKYPRYGYELACMDYYCPICERGFGVGYDGFGPDIPYEEDFIPAEGVYHGVLQKKVVWE